MRYEANTARLCRGGFRGRIRASKRWTEWPRDANRASALGKKHMTNPHARSIHGPSFPLGSELAPAQVAATDVARIGTRRVENGARSRSPFSSRESCAPFGGGLERLRELATGRDSVVAASNPGGSLAPAFPRMNFVLAASTALDGIKLGTARVEEPRVRAASTFSFTRKTDRISSKRIHPSRAHRGAAARPPRL